MTSTLHHRGALLSLAVLASACEPALESTELRISAYGEEFAEDHIPAEAFVDGWQVEFSRILIAITDVEADGEPLDGGFVLDLTQSSGGEGHTLGTVTVPAEGHPDLSYSIAPVTEATALSATDADLQEMIDRGTSVIGEGTATRGDQTVQFSWGFSSTTRYEHCHGTSDLAADAEPATELTIHVDHFFYDDLDSEDPNVAFDLIAEADADGDGDATPEELRAFDITGQTRYQVGSREITDLWGFIDAQMGTLGHIDGEGHCEVD